MLIPGGGSLKTDLQTILKTVQSAESDNSGKDAIDIDTNDIWTAIEPIFSFQGKIKRFLIESKEHPQISLITKTLDKVGELIDKLVYSALAILIEPAIQRVREAIKDGKETIEEVDRQNKNYVNIFAPGSTDSDPSHSVSTVKFKVSGSNQMLIPSALLDSRQGSFQQLLKPCRRPCRHCDYKLGYPENRRVLGL